MVSQIYPNELQLNKAIHSDTEAPCLDLDLSITNDIVSTKMYVKRDNFNFDIVHFSFLDGDVPRSNSSVYTIHNLFVLQEYVLILMTSTVKLYLYFIINTQSCWLLCLVCLPGVSRLLCGSSSQCHGFVCSL